MATLEQRKEALKVASKQISTLSAIDPKSLARTTDLSPEINFIEAVPYFEEMLDLCKQLSERDLARLSHQQLEFVTRACTTLEGFVSQVRDFKLNQNQPGDVCRSIISRIANGYDDVMNPLMLPLAFTATQATDYAKIEREAKGYHATMKSESEALSKFISTTKVDIERALAAVKEQAAEAGVSTNAQIFLQDADTHQKMSTVWLKATICSAIVTLLATIIGLITTFIYQPVGTGATIQYVVAKLLVISTLSFAVFWSARNYKSQKHNETLNKHRANALMTFRAFVEGTSDERVKDAILLQAAQAAFSSRPTGFDTADSESQSINPVVEIIGKTIPQQST